MYTDLKHIWWTVYQEYNLYEKIDEMQNFEHF